MTIIEKALNEITPYPKKEGWATFFYLKGADNEHYRKTH